MRIFQNITDSRFRITALELCDIIENVLMEHCTHKEEKGPDCRECKIDANRFAIQIMESLPDIRRILETDIEAAYEGDPAAKSFEEIVLSYPSFEAISIYRIAHTISELHIPLIPRIMTEYAHEHTGIDIHPQSDNR